MLSKRHHQPSTSREGKYPLLFLFLSLLWNLPWLRASGTQLRCHSFVKFLDSDPFYFSSTISTLVLSMMVSPTYDKRQLGLFGSFPLPNRQLFHSGTIILPSKITTKKMERTWNHGLPFLLHRPFYWTATDRRPCAMWTSTEPPRLFFLSLNTHWILITIWKLRNDGDCRNT